MDGKVKSFDKDEEEYAIYGAKVYSMKKNMADMISFYNEER